MNLRATQAGVVSEWFDGISLHESALGSKTAKWKAAACEEWSVGAKVFTLYPDKERIAQRARLESFRLLRPGWDSYDAEPPGDEAIENAHHILRVLWCDETAPPLRQISPSVEGGVALVFTGRDKKYADIECFNNGDILAITSDGIDEPSVWSIAKEGGSIRSAIAKLNSFFNG